ncbi:MAG: zinc-dependent metalloprotease [Gemmatimonadales bacterium]|nr:zinc-dependent metalloprotease [Gemmatimonadales bacterium]MDZ4388178.1 zinc-dependent metalloprotease [Gemmatimonadales bacterium]
MNYRVLLLLFVTALAAAPAPALSAQQRPAIAEAAKNFARQPGFIPVLHDTTTGKVWLELPDTGQRALFLVTLATGLGSNPIGLDRGANGMTQVVRFERTGASMRMVFENWRYRSSGDSAHLRTIRESFAESPVLALPITAESDGRVTVDAGELLFHDWNDVAGTLQRSQEGSWQVVKDRSRLHAPLTKTFPRNTELDVELAFSSSSGGRITRTILPDRGAFLLRQHLTLLALPDDDYRPRTWDPRTGYFGIAWQDYFQPLDGRLQQRVINRHRLQRRDPSDPRSPWIQPIVYYIDPGIPEPVKSATWEGAKWWEAAFNQAGLVGGFRVEWLPADADPMDIRYNVVQWENRNERGWSIGGALSDPRTGEMLKGMARMDSHRARTDQNIVAALLGANSAPADTAMILARIRQVTAHEIGHTLGLAHNYIASTRDRASVMDYPAPRARVLNGEIDLSDSYASGAGEFDVWAIRWGYGIWPAEQEADTLAAIVKEGLARGYLFLSDGDARPASAADPRTNLWDDGATPAAFLRDQLDVRRVGLSRFGLGNLRSGEPIALLEERLAPLYHWHRFAVASVAKAIGGIEYQYAVSGDGQTAVRPIPPAAQRAALEQLIATLDPAVLALPDTVIRLLPPVPGALADPVEGFRSRTTPMFDELGAARSLAQHTVDNILQRERLARLVAMAARDGSALTVAQVIDRLVAATWGGGDDSPYRATLRRIAARAVVDRLLELAADRNADQQVRDIVEWKLDEIGRRAAAALPVNTDPAVVAHRRAIQRDITRWIERRELPAPTPPLPLPPFDPFGDH